jgi:hypothetical protein
MYMDSLEAYIKAEIQFRVWEHMLAPTTSKKHFQNIKKQYSL